MSRNRDIRETGLQGEAVETSERPEPGPAQTWTWLIELLDASRKEVLDEALSEEEAQRADYERFDRMFRRFIEKLRNALDRTSGSLPPGRILEIALLLQRGGWNLSRDGLNETDPQGPFDSEALRNLDRSRTESRCRAMGIAIPEKQYFMLGEVAEILNVAPYVLRYWDMEFKIGKPTRTRARQRLYSWTDIERLADIKYLIYEEKYTIAGARKVMQREAKQRKELL